MKIKQIAEILNIEITDLPQEHVLELLERKRSFDKEGEPVYGKPFSHPLNASIVLENDSRLCSRFEYNEFNDQIFIGEEPINGSDVTEVYLWLHRVYGIRVGKEAVFDLIIHQAKSSNNRFHPLRNYLDSLPVWDGVDRVGSLLQKYWGVKDDPLLREIGKKWAVSCVARAMEPGAKVDTVLILCGAQGSLKSTSFRVLAGEDWFSDSHLDISKKEAYELIHQSGVWIWEMAEILTLQKSNNENQKMFLSAQSDRYRPSYGRVPVQKGRSVVFVGTTNEATFLTDGTGNRRYWPVNVGNIDIEAIAKDRDQIWSQTLKLYNNDETWWLDFEHEQKLGEYHKNFIVEDPWIDAVQKCIERYGSKGFMVRDVFDLLGMEHKFQQKKDIKRINMICNQIGLVEKRLSVPLSRHLHVKRPRVWTKC